MPTASLANAAVIQKDTDTHINMLKGYTGNE